jgi:signal transduction histidine kinase
VLRNLLTNAAKYSRSGAPIEVVARRHGGRVRVEVRDHGAGIPASETKRIFDKFERVEARDRRGVPGLGLGLYLSRGIVEAHGARLTVTSTPGEGSTFAFELEVVP